MKNLILLFITILAFQRNTFSQTQECGTEIPAGYKQLIQQSIANLSESSIQKKLTTVPVQIHLMRQSNGNSNLTIQQIRNELDSANYYYQNAGLIFVECGNPEMIDDDNYYDFDNTTDESYMLNNHFVPNVVNLYFGNTVTRNGTAVCGYAWYPGGQDACFISGSCATNGSSLAHELGHYMGVMHTHGGSPDELVDGSNCSTEGDYLCDTPADPNISGLVNSSCIYTGTDVDLNGMAYQPDVSNVMSYSRKSCRISFTPMQYALINSTFWNYRAYLQCISTEISEHGNVEVLFFPNPCINTLNITLNKGENQQYTIEVYNLFGSLVYQDDLYLNQTTSLDVSNFTSGFYTCKILAKGSTEIIHKVSIIR